MITAVYNSELHQLTVSGHAGSAEHGHDLVCAAASTLTYLFEGNMRSLQRKGYVEDVNAVLESGFAAISFVPSPHKRHVSEIVTEAILTGFEMLANQYPKYIRYAENCKSGG